MGTALPAAHCHRAGEQPGEGTIGTGTDNIKGHRQGDSEIGTQLVGDAGGSIEYGPAPPAK